MPAEQLAEFNAHLEGPVVVTHAFFGEGYEGHVPESFGLRGKDARSQFLALARTKRESGFDFTLESAANHVSVFLNYFFWEQADFSADAIGPAERDEVLGALRTVWNEALHGVGLGVA